MGETMSDRIAVRVHASDPITAAGIASALRPRPELRLVESGADEPATVGLVVTDDIDEAAVQVLRATLRLGCQRIVVVATQLDETKLVIAVEAGACGLVRRAEATPERLVAA